MEATPKKFKQIIIDEDGSVTIEPRVILKGLWGQLEDEVVAEQTIDLDESEYEVLE